MIVMLTETTGIRYEIIATSPIENLQALAFDRTDASMA
jgi:hypothetical protein